MYIYVYIFIDPISDDVVQLH